MPLKRTDGQHFAKNDEPEATALDAAENGRGNARRDEAEQIEEMPAPQTSRHHSSERATSRRDVAERPSGEKPTASSEQDDPGSATVEKGGADAGDDAGRDAGKRAKRRRSSRRKRRKRASRDSGADVAKGDADEGATVASDLPAHDSSERAPEHDPVVTTAGAGETDRKGSKKGVRKRDSSRKDSTKDSTAADRHASVRDEGAGSSDPGAPAAARHQGASPRKRHARKAATTATDVVGDPAAGDASTSETSGSPRHVSKISQHEASARDASSREENVPKQDDRGKDALRHDASARVDSERDGSGRDAFARTSPRRVASTRSESARDESESARAQLASDRPAREARHVAAAQDTSRKASTGHHASAPRGDGPSDEASIRDERSTRRDAIASRLGDPLAPQRKASAEPEDASPPKASATATPTVARRHADPQHGDPTSQRADASPRRRVVPAYERDKVTGHAVATNAAPSSAARGQDVQRSATHERSASPQGEARHTRFSVVPAAYGGPGKRAAGGHARSTSAPTRRRRRRPIVAAVLVVLVALVAAGGVCAWRLYQSAQRVRVEARSMLGVVDDLKDAVKEGDEELLRRVTSDVNVAAHNVEAEVTTPLWDLATWVPVVGEDVKSVQTLGAVMVDLSDNALSPLVANSADALNLKNLLQDGTVNIEALRKLISALDGASPVIVRSIDRIEALPEAHLEQVRDVLDKVKDKMATADVAFERLNAVIPYLPALFGADGQTRNYLLVALNNAELRSAGGFPGSWSLITVTDGRIGLADTATLQQEADGFLSFQPDELEVLPEMAGNAGSLPFSPNFSRVGGLMAEVYAYYRGVGINGTIAMDPVFLQRLLGLTGGVTAFDGTVVDGSNAAFMLMSDVYWRYGNDPTSQDAFFADVAGKAFAQLTQGLGSVHVKDLFNTVFDSAKEHRFQVWMADPAEQVAMDELGLSSSVSDDEAEPVLGVYLNDNTWGKMDWYVCLETTVGQSVANDDGTRTYDVVTSIANTATAEGLVAAPKYVYGYNEAAKRSQADVRMMPLLMAPAGGSIANVVVNGVGQLAEYTLYGHDAWYGLLNVDAQETATISYQVTVPATARAELTVWQTPTAQEFE